MEWRDVVGYEGVYEVSDTGLVRSLDRIVPQDHPRRKFVRLRGQLLKPHAGKYGHLSVRLCGVRLYVHAIVLAAFVGPRPQGMNCLHGRGGPQDNSVGNLRYGTQAENIRDLIEFGRTNYLPLKLADKLTEIKSRLQSGQSQDRIAAELGVAQSTVSRTLKLSQKSPR